MDDIKIHFSIYRSIFQKKKKEEKIKKFQTKK